MSDRRAAKIFEMDQTDLPVGQISDGSCFCFVVPALSRDP